MEGSKLVENFITLAYEENTKPILDERNELRSNILIHGENPLQGTAFMLPFLIYFPTLVFVAKDDSIFWDLNHTACCENRRMSEYIHKGHDVTILVYHLVFYSKYRRAVFDDRADHELRSVCLDIEQRYEVGNSPSVTFSQSAMYVGFVPKVQFYVSLIR